MRSSRASRASQRDVSRARRRSSSCCSHVERVARSARATASRVSEKSASSPARLPTTKTSAMAALGSVLEEPRATSSAKLIAISTATLPTASSTPSTRSVWFARTTLIARCDEDTPCIATGRDASSTARGAIVCRSAGTSRTATSAAAKTATMGPGCALRPVTARRLATSRAKAVACSAAAGPPIARWIAPTGDSPAMGTPSSAARTAPWTEPRSSRARTRRSTTSAQSRPSSTCASDRCRGVMDLPARGRRPQPWASASSRPRTPRGARTRTKVPSASWRSAMTRAWANIAPTAPWRA